MKEKVVFKDFNRYQRFTTNVFFSSSLNKRSLEEETLMINDHKHMILYPLSNSWVLVMKQ